MLNVEPVLHLSMHSNIQKNKKINEKKDNPSRVFNIPIETPLVYSALQHHLCFLLLFHLAFPLSFLPHLIHNKFLLGKKFISQHFHWLFILRSHKVGEKGLIHSECHTKLMWSILICHVGLFAEHTRIYFHSKWDLLFYISIKLKLNSLDYRLLVFSTFSLTSIKLKSHNKRIWK